MVSGRARQILEAVGFLSIVGSLIFVGFEMSQTQQISSADQDLTRAEISMDLRDSINENIEVWLAGNAGEPLDDASKAVYHGMVMNAWDRAEALSQARSRLGSDSNVAIHQFAAFLFENPGAREIWIEETNKQTANRELLDYNVPGYDLRRRIVFEDLEILSQQGANGSISNQILTPSSTQRTREEIEALNIEKQ